MKAHSATGKSHPLRAAIAAAGGSFSLFFRSAFFLKNNQMSDRLPMDTEFTAFDTTLRDGRALHIRAMRKADEAELLQAFNRLSPDARYMRFMRAVREPNLERLREALASFPESGFAIVATVPASDGFDIVGSATFVIESRPANCEFAITVAADYGGAGLGRTLLTALINAARKRGLSEMKGFVLAANKPMLRLAARVGFSVSPDPEDPSVRICLLRL